MRDVMLILHFIGLAMGLGTSFAHAFLGIASSKMSADEAIKFRMHSLVLSRLGHIGIILLIISGFYLITPYWSILSSSPLLIIKLVLVVILVVLIALLSMASAKAKIADADKHLGKMVPLGKMTLAIGVIIVILAVYIFR